MPDSIAFSRSIYDPEAVRAAAEQYAPLATIDVRVDGAEIIVTLTDPDPEVADEIAGAFANHALHETILRRRAAAGEATP